MKTTFKKTIAAMSAAAVVAASAAVMAVPASAASDAAITINSVEVTLAELAANDYQVTMPITISNNPGFNNVGFQIQWDESEVTYASNDVAAGMDGSTVKEGALWFAIMNQKAIEGTSVGSVTFTVNSAAAEGDVYKIAGVNADSDGNAAPFGKDGEDLGLAAVNGGTITIVAAATTAEPTTEAPAPVTTPAPTATPTTTTTTTAKPTTGSPKTGDALPVAGVAVAVAVIGGVALVSKKRK